MNHVIFVLLLVFATVVFDLSSSKNTLASATTKETKEDIYKKPEYKKVDGKKKVKVEEEEEEEIEEEEYEDEEYDDLPPGIRGILGLDPWKKKDEEKGVKKEPLLPPYGFKEEEEDEKKFKYDGESEYPNPKFFIPKDVPFKYPSFPKDIYKEEKENKAKPEFGKDNPFYGVPFLFGKEPKLYGFKPSVAEDSDEEEEKIDPKFLYREFLFGGHFFPRFPPYMMNPKLFLELLSEDTKTKSKTLKESSDIRKDVDIFPKDDKETVAVYKADTSAIKKSIKS